MSETNAGSNMIIKMKENKGMSIGVIAVIGIVLVIVIVVVIVLVVKFGGKLGGKLGKKKVDTKDIILVGYENIKSMGDINAANSLGPMVMDVTPEECSVLCNSKDGCEMFTYDNDNKGCLLKKSIHHLEYNPNLFTSVKVNPNSQVVKDVTTPYKVHNSRKQNQKDISAWIDTKDGMSINYCKDACDKLNNCKGVMEEISGGKCILKGLIETERFENDINANMYVKTDKIKDYDSFYGVDTNTEPYEEIITNDISKCANKCNEDPTCEGFSHREGKCNLKNEGMYKLDKYREELNTYLWRKDKKSDKVWDDTINGTWSDSSSKYISVSLNIEDCKSLCEESESCKGFNYIKSAKHCQFKNDVLSNPVNDTDRDYYQLKPDDKHTEITIN
jgi:hypothetical protein